MLLIKPGSCSDPPGMFSCPQYLSRSLMHLKDPKLYAVELLDYKLELWTRRPSSGNSSAQTWIKVVIQGRKTFVMFLILKSSLMHATHRKHSNISLMP